jgi:hypothetical protein
LAVKIYLGGHTVEIVPSGGSLSVLIDGTAHNLEDQKEHEHIENGQEIFKYGSGQSLKKTWEWIYGYFWFHFRIFRWGSTYNVYSFLKVWVAYDGNFVEVMPAPSVKGSHCGVCGTFNKNKFDEFSGKSGNRIASSDMASEWQWKC